jgi:metal-responsive CopG/Arc/MetJ family transcriptional regulator
MHAKLEKVTVSLSDELCRSIDVLCKQFGLSRSRLIETCLREHPSVEAAVRRNRGQSQVAVVQTACSLCKKKLGEDDVRIETPKYGVLCLDCWAEKMGDFVEKHLISDRGSRAKG